MDDPTNLCTNYMYSGDNGEEYVELPVRIHLCMISKVTLMQLYLMVKDCTPLNGDNMKFCCSFYVFT